MYYNTTHAKGYELKRATKKAETQKAKILKYFKKYKGNYTPCEIQLLTDLQGAPLTSIRRAMTDLTDEGEIKKTDIQRRGIYGKSNYVWELA